MRVSKDLRAKAKESGAMLFKLGFDGQYMGEGGMDMECMVDAADAEPFARRIVDLVNDIIETNQKRWNSDTTPTTEAK